MLFALLNNSVATRVDMFAIGHMLQILRLSCQGSHVDIEENLAVDNLSHVTISMTETKKKRQKSLSLSQANIYTRCKYSVFHVNAAM